MVTHTCNPRTWQAEAGTSPVGGQRELHSEILSLKKKCDKTTIFIGSKSSDS
jgi:hypothetical protein